MNEELEVYFFSKASLKPPGALPSDVRTAVYEPRSRNIAQPSL